MNPIPFPKTLAAALLAGAMLLDGCSGAPAKLVPMSYLEDQVAKVQRGMTRDDVLGLLGKPQETMRFPTNRSESFDYVGPDTWGYTTRFSVVFDEGGRVVDIVKARLNDGGDNKGR
jgi:outer membrane protein assembly factor BamE (lipoprotein component of BamABCDE complex)